MGESNGKTQAAVKSTINLGLTVVGAILSAYVFLDSRLDNINARVFEVEKALAVTEGNRFTSEDGLAVLRQIVEIREQLAGFPPTFPPKWFEDDVEEVKAMQTQERNKIDDLTNRVIRLEAKIN